LILECVEVREAMGAVEEDRADAAFLPVENSTAGTIPETCDEVIRSSLQIAGEAYFPVHHCLLGLPGAELSGIRRVSSHPAALRQCAAFLSSLENCLVEPHYDTAGAARMVRDKGDPAHAAVAGGEVGEIYGLRVLREGIEDVRGNCTRFWVLSRSAAEVDPGDPAKTTLYFTTDHRPGALAACLAALAAGGLNLTKLESRPLPRSPWEYGFLLDAEGNPEEENFRRVLDALALRTRLLRILGCYPRAGKAKDI
jgi:prephenate dehydratase